MTMEATAKTYRYLKGGNDMDSSGTCALRRRLWRDGVNRTAIGGLQSGYARLTHVYRRGEDASSIGVDNSQPVVLGGIYEQSLNKSTSQVPFFSDVPLLVRLLRNDFNNIDKAELLIFVAPKNISDNIALAR
jgi:hypothetical protein